MHATAGAETVRPAVQTVAGRAVSLRPRLLHGGRHGLPPLGAALGPDRRLLLLHRVLPRPLLLLLLAQTALPPGARLQERGRGVCAVSGAQSQCGHHVLAQTAVRLAHSPDHQADRARVQTGCRRAETTAAAGEEEEEESVAAASGHEP